MTSRRRLIAAALLVLVVAVVGAAVWTAAQPRSPAQRLEAANALASGIHMTATVTGSSLLATNATADFGVGNGIRLVHVRITDELRLDLRITTDRDVVLAGPPRLCLVGPYSAPDDAGLTDRCWGEPDLAALLLAHVSTDGTGRPVLAAATPIALSVTLRRGDVRCDYPPGTWQLELTIDPLIDRSASGERDAPSVKVEVPFAGTSALPFVTESRYCGLADTIYRDQGEPPLAP